MLLYPHQKKLLAVDPDRHLLYFGTGAGKSLMAIELAKKRKKMTLVICPKILKEKWDRDMVGSGLRYTVITKEQFKTTVKSLNNFPTVIVDEAHYFSGITSQLHKSLVEYFKKWETPNRYLLTATPYLSTPWNIYALGILMGLPLSYRKFRDTFFVDVRMGRRVIPQQRKGKKYDAALKKILNSIGSGEQLEDLFDVPTQTHETVALPLSEDQVQQIEEAYDPVPIVRWTMIHQIENLGDPKIVWVLKFAETHKKFVIFCRYLEQMYSLEAALDGYGHDTLMIHGGIKDRDTVISAANIADSGVLIIQASCSEGYELPGFDTVVYASLSFSYKDLVQSQGRVLRANALHENHFYYLVMEGGVDAEVYRAMERKEDFSFELLS